jgi:hypothetical protein
MMVSMFMLLPFARKNGTTRAKRPAHGRPARVAAEQWQVRTLASVRGRTHTNKMDAATTARRAFHLTHVSSATDFMQQ